MGFTLHDIVPWGRNLNEYRMFFGLTNSDLSKKILACADGPASFNAEVTGLGGSCISIDPIYKFSAEQIRGRIEETAQTVFEQLLRNADAYNWNYYSNPKELLQTRLSAMETFLNDFEAGRNEGRYISESLPDLSLVPNNQELVLCSHFLFLYSDHLSLDFHKEAIVQMLGKGNELRIFPVCTLTGNSSPYLPEIEIFLKQKKIDYRVEQIDYEFQKGGNQMLRIFQN